MNRFYFFALAMLMIVPRTHGAPNCISGTAVVIEDKLVVCDKNSLRPFQPLEIVGYLEFNRESPLAQRLAKLAGSLSVKLWMPKLQSAVFDSNNAQLILKVNSKTPSEMEYQRETLRLFAKEYNSWINEGSTQVNREGKGKLYPASIQRKEPDPGVE